MEIRVTLTWNIGLSTQDIDQDFTFHFSSYMGVEKQNSHG